MFREEALLVFFHSTHQIPYVEPRLGAVRAAELEVREAERHSGQAARREPRRLREPGGVARRALPELRARPLGVLHVAELHLPEGRPKNTSE